MMINSKAHVLPPELLLDMRNVDIPVRDAFNDRRRDGRRMRNVDRPIRIEPINCALHNFVTVRSRQNERAAHHISLGPIRIEDRGEEGEGDGARGLDGIGEHLEEALVVGGVAAAEGLGVDPVPGDEGFEGVTVDEAPADVVVNLLGETVRENVFEVRGNVGGGDGRCRRGHRESDREGQAAPLFGGEDEGVLEEGVAANVKLGVVDGEDLWVDGVALDELHPAPRLLDILGEGGEADFAEGREGGTEVAAGEEGEVEEEIAGEAEVGEEGAFGRKGDGALGKVDAKDDLVDTVVAEDVVAPVDGMDVGFW
jgi:hypothetical protein